MEIPSKLSMAPARHSTDYLRPCPGTFFSREFSLKELIRGSVGLFSTFKLYGLTLFNFKTRHWSIDLPKFLVNNRILIIKYNSGKIRRRITVPCHAGKILIHGTALHRSFDGYVPCRWRRKFRGVFHPWIRLYFSISTKICRRYLLPQMSFPENTELPKTSPTFPKSSTNGQFWSVT